MSVPVLSRFKGVLILFCLLVFLAGRASAAEYWLWADSAAKTMRQVQLKRIPVFKLEKELAAVKTPVLLMVGDEDESCIDVNIWLKRTIPSSRLVAFPGCGHVLHLEEPELFNHLSEQFLSSVDRGTWYPRDPATMPEAAGSTAVGLGDNKDD